MRKETGKKAGAALLAAMMAVSALGGTVTVQAEEGELKTIRILGIDNSGTDDSGTTVYLSDWVNGDSKMWEKLTSDLAERGVKLELDLIPSDQYDTVIQTQLAAGLDCDMVNLHGIDTKTRSRLISQGRLVSINDIWENYSGEEAKQFYTEGYGGEVAKLNTMEDGNVYWLSATTVGDYKGTPWGGFVMPMIRKDWLDNLGLVVPTTLDELKEIHGKQVEDYQKYLEEYNK